MGKLRTTKTVYGKVFVLGIFLILYSFLHISVAEAATLHFSPQSGTYEVGQLFSVQVLVASPAKKMNAVGATISFSPSDLELISLSESGSLIEVWGESPEFSNSTGRVSFEGLILDGYQGESGKIITMVFRAKNPGEATLRFSSGGVLAYDGLGTSILAGLEHASFTIVGTESSKSLIPEEIPEGFQFKKDLELGNRDIDVAYLQLCLTAEGVYSNDITGYYGPLTKGAVVEFQEKYSDDILGPQESIQGTGLVYSSTREKLDEVCPTTGAPEQLFDISVMLENANISKASDLEVVIDFFSFGRVPTPVDIAYSILNEENQIVFKDSGIAGVETEQIVRKRFSSLSLIGGKYTLLVKTRYNVDVVDEFRNDFVVREAGEDVFATSAKIFTPIILLTIFIIILILMSSNIFWYWQCKSLNRRRR